MTFYLEYFSCYARWPINKAVCWLQQAAGANWPPTFLHFPHFSYYRQSTTNKSSEFLTAYFSNWIFFFQNVGEDVHPVSAFHHRCGCLKVETRDFIFVINCFILLFTSNPLKTNTLIRTLTHMGLSKHSTVHITWPHV